MAGQALLIDPVFLLRPFCLPGAYLFSGFPDMFNIPGFQSFGGLCFFFGALKLLDRKSVV